MDTGKPAAPPRERAKISIVGSSAGPIPNMGGFLGEMATGVPSPGQRAQATPERRRKPSLEPDAFVLPPAPLTTWVIPSCPILSLL
jgi:hypothetical protein